MDDYKFLVEFLRFVLSGIRYVNFRSGVTGKLNDDGTLNQNATEGLADGYIWVRFGGDRTASAVKNMTMRNAAGVDVEVVYDLHHAEDQVWEVDRVRALVALGSATAAAMNVPEQGANIPTPVSAGDVIPGGLFVDEDGGLIVRIMPTWTPFNDWWDGTEPITLTPTATSDSKSFAVVGIQSDGTTIVTLSADRPLAYPLVTLSRQPTTGGAADIQAVTTAAPTVWWVGAVELANGDTSVNAAKIVDRRFWTMPTMTGADGSTAGAAGLVPAPAATDNTKYLRGDGVWATVSGSGGGGATPQGYIAGLEVDCASTTQVTIQPGHCRDDADGYTMIRATADGALTVDITASGANGLDTGSEASNTWYYVWLIAKSSDGTLAGLLSTSATAPTLPSGYDKQRCVGVVRNNASSNLLRGRTQRGSGAMRYWLYHENTMASPFRVLAAVNLTTTTWTDVDCSAIVPPLSREARIHFYINTPSSTTAISWRENGVTTHEQTLITAITNHEANNTVDVPLDASQIGEAYSYLAATEDFYADVLGYWYHLLPTFSGTSG